MTPDANGWPACSVHGCNTRMAYMHDGKHVTILTQRWYELYTSAMLEIRTHPVQVLWGNFVSG